MTEHEAIGLFKCLSDKSRLQILKSLAIEDMYVERLKGWAYPLPRCPSISKSLLTPGLLHHIRASII